MDKKEERFDRNALGEFLGDYLHSGMLHKDFRKLSPEKRIDSATRLASFVLPKLKSVGMDVYAPKGTRKGNPLTTLFPELDGEGEEGI